MKKFQLQSILDLSNLRLDESTRRLGELISHEQEAARRHDMLVEYRNEYHTRFMAAAQNGLGPEEWRNFRAFLDRLDAAIAQADTVVHQSKTRTADGQQDWLDKRGRVKAFDTLAERHQAKAEQDAARRTQKGLDEHAARQYKIRSEEEE